MDVIEAPNKYYLTRYARRRGRLGIFLAGGITNCPNWQEDAINMINSAKFNPRITPDKYVILNPRRTSFCANDFETQVRWEFKALSKSTHVLFWFPKETLCPITLLELGKELSREGSYRRNVYNMHVGCHPDYERKFDVELQCLLAKGISVHSTLSDTVKSLTSHL